MHRIASLLPSTTEIACALGCEDALVARSHEGDFPASVAGLPALTAPKLDADAPSREIDDRVRALVSEGLSVYRVDAEKLRELAPTAILTQDQCDVCAVSPRDLEDALAAWIGERPRVVSTRAMTLDDVWSDMQRVADALDAPERGRELVRQLRERIGALSARAARASDRPRTACVEWIDPLMSAGNWMPELVTLAGGTPLLGEAGAHSPWMEWSELRDADPDAIVVLPCGFDLERTRNELPPLLEQPGWADLTAVRAGRVYLTDGTQYFNRPGPRLADSLEVLAEILHPREFPRSHPSHTWQAL